MANETRRRYNFQAGTITNNPLASGGTSLTSAALASLPAVASTEHLVIVLDPLGANGAPEVVYVTAHTASSTSATIARGKEGSSARSHASGTVWRHVATVFDYAGSPYTSGTRPSNPFEGQLIYETDTDSYKGYNGSAWEQALTLGAWTSYTPTLTQSGAVSKTVTYAKYAKVGRTVTVNVVLAATGAGTSSNKVTVSLPVTAASSGYVVGSGYVFDTSASDTIVGSAYLDSTSTVGLLGARASGNLLGTGAGFSAALASGDGVSIHATYEAAS